MTDAELLALIEQEEANCLSSITGKLAESRRAAMQYYYGEPYGNEVEGRSQVITTEVKDAVEGILPMLMDIFSASDEIVRCEAKKPQDEQAAQQATDYLNYVFWERNPGFLVLYALFKDALLQKNGFVKAWWDEYEESQRETYENLTDAEFLQIAADPEVELIEHTENMQTVSLPGNPGMPPQSVPIKYHDAVFRRNRKHGKVCVEPCPPEEILISRDTRNDLSKSRFVEHRTRKSLSEIREMGFDVPDEIADYAPNADFNMERMERDKFDDAYAYSPDPGNADPSTRRVWLAECYLHVDYDGDGIAEFRRIIKVGRKVLDNEEFDSLPVISGTAILMPHKHYGLSIYDLIGEVQLQKSMLLRNIFDNTYNANNGRWEALDQMVNMEDLMNSRPGGIVRVKALGAVKRLDTPVLGAPAYQLLEYLDKVKQNRVGITDFPQGVNPDAINQKAHVAELIHNASQERVHLMARILGELAVKPLFLKILELVSKHQNQAEIVKLRGKWVEVNPREWADKFEMTVTVGIGTGSQGAVLQGAQQILNTQVGLVKEGMGRIVSEGNAYAAAHKLAKSVFPKDADQMFTDPASLPPPQPQPNPEMIKIQAGVQKAQMADEFRKLQLSVQAQLEERDRQFQAQQSAMAAQIDAALQERQHQMDAAMHLSDREQKSQDKLTELAAEMRARSQEQSMQQTQLLMQGLIDKALENQRATHDMVITKLAEQEKRITEMHKIAAAPKEIIRDPKTKRATGVRPVLT